jgi:iron complex transport system substrate-binding protein
VGQRLETINQQMNQVLRKVTERVAEIPVDKRKTAYFASSQGIFTTTTGNMLQHEIFTRAGLINVSGSLTGYFQAVSPEQLVRWNPDIIVLSQHLNKGESRKLSDPVLKTLSAVAARQVFRCPSNISPWDFPSPLSVLATVWMAQKAYPEIFHDVDLQKKADQFHHTLFGKTMTQMGGTILDPVEF